jgi:hypothetical protein
MGKIFLDIRHRGALKVAFKIIPIVDLEDPPSASRGPGKFCHKRETEILHYVAVMQMIIKFRPGMRYAPHVEKRGLFDFLIRVKVCLQTGKDLFAHGREELGIIKGRVENNRGIKNQFLFVQGIIMEIRFHPEGKNLWNSPQSAPQRNKRRIALSHLDPLPAGRIIWKHFDSAPQL